MGSIYSDFWSVWIHSIPFEKYQCLETAEFLVWGWGESRRGQITLMTLFLVGGLSSLTPYQADEVTRT